MKKILDAYAKYVTCRDHENDSLHVEKCFMSAVLSTHISETVEETKEQ